MVFRSGMNKLPATKLNKLISMIEEKQNLFTQH